MNTTFSLLRQGVFLTVKGIAVLLYAGGAVMFLTAVLLLWDLVFADWVTFEQPRDALRNGHASHYQQLTELVSASCAARSCTEEDLEAFITVRDRALEADWPELLDVMLQGWRWRRYATKDRNWGYTFRDDFFDLIETVGGREVALACTPVVTWRLLRRGPTPSFAGLRCDGVVHELRF